jgi:hypothetical protein
MNAAAVLAWLDRHARQILIQDISPKRRQKNRCILQYLPPDSTSLEVVGSHSIETAHENKKAIAHQTVPIPEVLHAGSHTTLPNL